MHNMFRSVCNYVSISAVLTAVCGQYAYPAEAWNASRDFSIRPRKCHSWSYAYQPGKSLPRIEYGTALNALVASSGKNAWRISGSGSSTPICVENDSASGRVRITACGKSGRAATAGMGLLVWTAPRGGYYQVDGQASLDSGVSARLFGVGSRLRKPLLSSTATPGSKKSFSGKVLLIRGDRLIFGAEPVEGVGRYGTVTSKWRVDIRWVPTVPEPWTPLAVDGLAVKCWNRSYDMGGSVLPEKITSGGVNLLDGPMQIDARLLADVDDPANTWFGFKQKWEQSQESVEQADSDVVRMSVESASEKLVAKCNWRVEFDGMALCELTLAPKSGSATLRSLDLLIPFNPKIAKLYYHQPVRIPWEHNWAREFTEPFPCGAIPDYMGLPFVHQMWVGDEERGLEWFAESAQGLSPVGDFLTIDRRRIMKISLLGIKEISSKKPFRFTFGLMASPVKPMKTPYQTRWAFGFNPFTLCKSDSGRVEDSPLGAMQRRGIKYFWVSDKRFSPNGDPWIADAGHVELDAVKKAAAKLDMTVMGTAGAWVDTGNNKDHKPEWDLCPRAVDVNPDYLKSYRGVSACQGSSWQGWVLDRCERVVNDLGLSGFYFDGPCTPIQCTNAAHGCGYTDSTGTHPTAPILATREFMKSIYLIARSIDRPSFVMTHISSYISLPCMSFADAYLDGEQANYAYPESPGWTMEGFRAEFIGHPFGIPAVYLHYTNRNPAVDTLRTNAYGVIHGLTPMCITEDGGLFWKATERFGTADAEWVPYWKSGGPVTTDADIKISSYVKKGQGALCVLGNLAYSPVSARVRIDASALGIDGTPRVCLLTGHFMSISEQELPLKEGDVTIDIGPGTFTLLQVDARPK